VNPAIAGAVFAVIFVGELPDKTMLASLVMATRGRPFEVWLGSAAAFFVHVVIATTLGTVVFHLLSPQALDGVVAALFLAGAALAAAEAVREHRRHGQPEPPPPVPPARPGRTAVTAFALIFAAEWGDLTQLLTANLAVHYHSPLSVATGATLALWAAAALAVTGGRWLGKLVNAVIIRAATAVLLAGLGGYAIWAAVS
jgi:Ca2+/H+ antiporter, TMEM165/GDT1 family